MFVDWILAIGFHKAEEDAPCKDSPREDSPRKAALLRASVGTEGFSIIGRYSRKAYRKNIAVNILIKRLSQL